LKNYSQRPLAAVVEHRHFTDFGWKTATRPALFGVGGRTCVKAAERGCRLTGRAVRAAIKIFAGPSQLVRWDTM